MEVIGLIGGLLALIGLFWLIAIAFQEGGILWGIVVIVFSWMGGLVFCIVKKKGWLQFGLLFGGLILIVIGFASTIRQWTENNSVF